MSRLSTVTLAATLLALSTGVAEAQAAALYPDLQTLPPRDLRFDRADFTADPATEEFRNVLRFSNTVVNGGEGPLVITGKIDSRTKSGAAVQRIHNDDGTFTDQAGVGQYYYHPEHDHYHFEDWGRYELWSKTAYDQWIDDGRPAREPDRVGTKTTSCALDEEFIRTMPGTPAWPGLYEAKACSPNASGVMTQGLSVGWGDTYDYYRFEQWIDLGQSTLEDGDYVLRSVADPLDKIHESADRNASREGQLANEAVTPFKIVDGTIVDSAPPSGTLSINDVDAETASTSVKVRAIGRDDVSGVTGIRVSNDGVTWKSYTYGAKGSYPMTIGWDLADARYGGSTRAGIRTVYAQFRDASGKWSASETDTIRLTEGEDSGPVPSDSRYANRVKADDPISYWRLGENSGTVALDEMGANDGVYRGAPALGAPGLLNSDEDDTAARFDGVDDAVNVPTPDSLTATSSSSVEAWIKPDSLPAEGTFASIAARRNAYSLQLNGSRLEYTIVQGGLRRRLQAPAGAVVAGQQHHVVGTYNGTIQRLFVDGQPVASIGRTGDIDAGSAFDIGAYDRDKERFAGTIDEVAVYGSPLPPLQVTGHYNQGVSSAVGVATPANLTAVAASHSEIDLRWSDQSDNESGFVLQRSRTASFDSTRDIALNAGTTTYRDAGLDAGTTYHYRVQAVNPSDSSSYSNAASAQTARAATPVTPAPVPTATPSPVVTPKPTPAVTATPQPAPAPAPSDPAPPTEAAPDAPAAGVTVGLRSMGLARTQDLGLALRRGVRLSLGVRQETTVKVTIRLAKRDAQRLGIAPIVRNATLSVTSGRSAGRLRLRSTAVAGLRNQRRVVLEVSVKTPGASESTRITRKVTLVRR